MRARQFTGTAIVMTIVTLATLSVSVAAAATGALGIYVYENIEGYHRVASTSGTELSAALLTAFARVMAYDKIPLQSNETVRILDEMTKDREVVVTSITTWLHGEILAMPTVKFKDDAIKFSDLTWHVDQDKVVADAKTNKLDHILIGSITGLVNPVQSASSPSGRKLFSVQAMGNFRLIDLRNETTVWAQTYRETQAGFDTRGVFDELAARVGEAAGRDIVAALPH